MNNPDYWLNTLMECNRRDHSPEFSSGDQRGPTRSSRAFAIALRAMADAFFKAGGVWPLATARTDYLAGLNAAPAGAQPDSALHGAATTILLGLYPKLTAYINQQSNQFGAAHNPSVHYGRYVALAHFGSRASDGSSGDVPYQYGETYGAHRPDPDNDQPEPLGAHWGGVASFIGLSSNVLLAPFPGHVGQGQVNRADAGYAAAVADVMAAGHSGIAQTQPNNALIGTYWAYDGANRIGTPPRLYLQIVQIVATNNALTDPQKMLLYAAVGTAQGEAGIQAWYNKYVYNLWRPVIGVREHDASMGPVAVAGHPAPVAGNPFWLPLGAPRTNSTGKNFTPDFPAYPSGHATFGAASLHVTELLLAKLVKKPMFAFEFASDEMNGVSKDVRGTTRSRHLRRFTTLKEAYVENGVSRIYLGVHWRFDSHLEDKNGDPIVKSPGDPQFVGGLPLGVYIAQSVSNLQ